MAMIIFSGCIVFTLINGLWQSFAIRGLYNDSKPWYVYEKTEVPWDSVIGAILLFFCLLGIVSII